MTENNERINQLLAKAETMLRRQENFSKEINVLRAEINLLRSTPVKEQVEEKKEMYTVEPAIPLDMDIKNQTVTPVLQIQQQETVREQLHYPVAGNTATPKVKSGLEKFIGENLINKIGIAITIIGVGIGAKYSIEHQLISPLTRIILGYLVGLGLLAFGIKLKKNYEGYSAVLVSGAIAIMYLITYAAYGFYGLMPQALTFVLMVIFTAFAVVAAINYNQQVIAHIGLVGAYAVPFLLSDGSGKVVILFSYMSIINMGILSISVKKYWKPLYHSSFLLSWLIFFAWFITKYNAAEYFTVALVFASVFFAIFYFIFLAYKLFKKEKFATGDIILLLANSFIFYGIGYSILNSDKSAEQLLGLFTLGNAIIHFVVSAIIYRQKLADRNLFFLVSGLVLVFITIAIPVQLDGNWVTLLWAGEAALLFWIGRTKNVPVYEKLSYALMLLAFVSIVQDWIFIFGRYDTNQPVVEFTPLFNINFLSSLLFIAAFVFINYLNSKKKYLSSPQKGMQSAMRVFIPAILLVVLYCSFYMEISGYCDQLYRASALVIKKGGLDDVRYYWNEDLADYKIVWLINYSLLFFSLMSFVNIKKLESSNLGVINLVLDIITILVFLAGGLYILSELRERYLSQELSAYYHRTGFNIAARYISYVFISIILTSIFMYLRQDFMKPVSARLRAAFDFLLYISLLWIASSELITWMDMYGMSESYKLGLSILWGVYALILIILGIWKKKAYLRIGAIILFAVTLVKLFFYDISYLGTIAKTIVFVSLGILLLIISFLYNKYKHVIADEN